MLCALSGKDAVEPVVSAVSGKVYERALIETWIAERGTDPATGAPLDAQQLVRLDIVPANAPLTAATSIPALLQALQTEFNALALENFELRQKQAQHDAALAESAHKVDAALRVITRLTQERDELRHALETLDVNADAVATPEPPQIPVVAPDHSQGPQGQGKLADARTDNDTTTVPATATATATAPAPAAESSSGGRAPQPIDSHMDVDEHAAAAAPTSTIGDIFGQHQPELPHMPLVLPHDNAAYGDIDATRRELTAQRKLFNAAVSRRAFPDPAPLLLPDISGDHLRVFKYWAIVTNDGKDTLYDLRTLNPVEIKYSIPVRRLSFVADDEKLLLAALGARRMVIMDLTSLSVLREYSTLGNPLDVVRHPAGPLVVQFASKIQMYDFDALRVLGDPIVQGFQRANFALHPDGEFLIHFPNDMKIVFHSLIKHEDVLVLDVNGPVSCITASANGFHVAYFEANHLAIVDLRKDDKPRRFLLPDTLPRQLCFDSTGRRLYVSTANKVLQYARPPPDSPEVDEWTEQPGKGAAENLIVAWSGDKTQIPLAIKNDRF